MLVVRGIWSDDTTMWLNGPVLRVAATTAPSPPAGMYTLNMATNQLTRAPGFDGASGGAGIWSDEETMWVAKPGWLRAYHLETALGGPNSISNCPGSSRTVSGRPTARRS